LFLIDFYYNIHLIIFILTQDLDVRGNTRCNDFEVSPIVHPVIEAMYDRKNNKERCGSSAQRLDSRRIALAIEGGGMRGCVASGMVSAIKYLGLQDTIDVVYGSSAGALVGAYFISDQMPYFGPEVYYDVLTMTGRNFIDTSAILRASGMYN
jgi:hypothetical protein